MNRAALDCARETLLASEPAELTPDAVMFLLREYVSGGADRVREAAEQGLTQGLAAADSDADPCLRVQWLRALAEGAAVSDDPQLHDVVGRALPSAIESLEMHVRHLYEPGEGLLDASCADQLRCGSALLAAFDLSGRLPYTMLAEELLRHARGRWWSDERDAYDADFAANCTALRVLCRLAALHADADYTAAAVLGAGISYADDARRMVPPLTRHAGAHPDDAGHFGSALLEWFALESDLQ